MTEDDRITVERGGTYVDVRVDGIPVASVDIRDWGGDNERVAVKSYDPLRPQTAHNEDVFSLAEVDPRPRDGDDGPKEYRCTRCSDGRHGDFVFSARYTDTDDDVHLSRCPLCGALTDDIDVEEVDPDD